MTKEEERVMIREMSDEELHEYLKQKELTNAATVADFVQYLMNNFKTTNKLCYMDCVEGVKNDCTYIERNQLGDKFFKYVSDDKKRLVKENYSNESASSFYPNVCDNAVIVC